MLGAGSGVFGYIAGTQADTYYNDTDDFDQWAGLQKVGYGVGAGLLVGGIVLVILDATDTSLVKGEDELDPMAEAPSPRVTPFVSGGLVGADVRF